MKANYWSCSKFTDWIRGTPKPPWGTTEEWGAWEKAAKTKKVRYWLAEEGFDYLQDIIYWPINRINAVRCYINYRWFLKKHALTSNLERGEWHEFDTRLLHAVFDELVNFVEIEQAWMQVVFSEEDKKKYNTPWYRSKLRIGVWRCPEAGIDYLNWAAGLKHDEDWMDKNDPQFGQPTSQAIAAQETLALYKWRKEDRRKRPDPFEVSGLDEYYEKKRKAAEERGDDPLWGSFKNKTEDEGWRTMSNLCHEIEKEQDDEDTAMLIRLVKIRQSLWT
jgi:hypothetical protein